MYIYNGAVDFRRVFGREDPGFDPRQEYISIFNCGSPLAINTSHRVSQCPMIKNIRMREAKTRKTKNSVGRSVGPEIRMASDFSKASFSLLILDQLHKRSFDGTKS